MNNSFIRFMALMIPCVLFPIISTKAQDFLPPAPAWQGKSLELVVPKNNRWITPAEKSDFTRTGSYDETMDWLLQLCTTSQFFKLVSIGNSSQDRPINMVIASSDKHFTADALRNSGKPIVLIQAGIHAGEIDGKDAGMMLLRDLAFGAKKHLLNDVIILFIPILNVDGHERVSAYNRVNQRGPSNMGWRTNARNLNLNRDYAKADTEEITAVLKVINDYDPHLYLDLHVTDGADYQYDITYGYSDYSSPASGRWLKAYFSSVIDQQLKSYGHIPGPLVFATNDVDFTDGMTEWYYTPRFSNGYGDVRHLPTILVENHSLKPFKQRVLGTYVFLEAVLNILSKEGRSLQEAILKDKKMRTEKIVLTRKAADKPERINFLGIRSETAQSTVTNKQYVVWTAQPIKQEINYYRQNVPDKQVARPKALWIPSTHRDVIERLRRHGIILETIQEKTTVRVDMMRIAEHKFTPTPVEGHFMVQGKTIPVKSTETFYPGAVKVTTDQPLGDLLVHLLHPDSPDSFFQWGFFPEIFSRTEYIEQYVSEPMAKSMLEKDPKLKLEFEEKKKNDPGFAEDPRKIYQWFYERSNYYDNRYLLYPIGFEY